jgi:general nucleoside transport system ATP-binding protein
MTLAVDMRGITKRFAGTLANDQVDFQLVPGEIHALLGENGAGKSTLMHILSGLYRPDAGDIFLQGQKVRLLRPSDAIAHGIGMVHQHFMLVPVMTVTENIILGQDEAQHGPFLNLRRAAQHIRALAEQYHLDVEPLARVQELPVGIRQRVEILKALYRHATILILDEPTAVLTPAETTQLFRTLTALTHHGTSIIFITHKLREVFEVAHRITVLRSGRVVSTTTPAQATTAELATLMVGHTVPGTVAKKPGTPAGVVLHVQDLRVLDDRGAVAVDNVSFTVRAGEIVGIAGVQGNGQTELVEALTGLRAVYAGRIAIRGMDTTSTTPRQLIAHGVAHIPEDRHKHAMVASDTIANNLILNTYYQPPFAHGLVRREAITAQHARRLMQEFDIRASSVYTQTGNLSGGNQQKLVVARECSRPITLLIAAQPTRGLDVGAMAFVQQRLIQQRDQGCAVLLVSSELDEILVLSDRIIVMYGGRLTATLDSGEATRQLLGQLLAGVQH